MSDMHSHDHDLIAALAEGILAEGLAASAEAEIAACPECSADLASQRAALGALAGLPAAALTAEESAGLRASVAGALSLPAVPSPAAPASRRPTRWAALAFAAGLAGVVMAVPVLGLMLADGSDDAAGTTSAVAAVFEDEAGRQGTDTSATATDGGEATTEMLETPPAPTEESTVGTIPPVAGSAEAMTTTTAADTTTTAEEGEDAATEVKGEEGLRALFEQGPEATAQAYGEPAVRAAADCSAEAEKALGEGAGYVEVSATIDDGLAVVVYVDAAWTVLVAFDPEDCSVVITLP
ncbi:MAG: hypothetical protein KQH83_04470 [Actinobacteria bacterium]|nr:hypothetical protein [Actinomycetota bacterium]